LLAEGRLRLAQCRGIPPFQAAPAEKNSVFLLQEIGTPQESVLPNYGTNFDIAKQPRFSSKIPEVNPATTGEPVNKSLIV
jgi:hypothetical protein